MGLISFFKRKFSKDIKIEQDILGYLVFPYKAKNNKIGLNHKAIVPENAVLVFASKGKVLDILQTGETMLGAITLPKCSKKFGLYKLDKNGKVPKEFSAFAYFISTAEQKNFKFSTYKKLRYANEKDGRFWVDINFEIDFKVIRPEKFLQSLLVEFSYLKFQESEKILSDWLSEFATDQLLKTDYMRSNFQENKAELLQILFLKVQKNMASYGLELQDLRFGEIKMSKNKESRKTKKVLEKLAENQAKSAWSGLEKLENQTNLENSKNTEKIETGNGKSETGNLTEKKESEKTKTETQSTFAGLETKTEVKSTKKFVELE